MELLDTDTLDGVREKLKKVSQDRELPTCRVPILDAVGQICSETLNARENIPAFRRSTVDGYAIRARDSYGSGDASPAFYNVIGRVAIEADTALVLGPGEAAQVQTGSKVPEGATAVLMVEYTENYAPGKIVGYKAVSESENLIQVGEDIQAGVGLVQRGRRLEAGDIGVLAAQGISEIEIYEAPRVTILSTGDELADIGEVLCGSKIRDINSYALAAATKKAGMKVLRRLRTGDDEAAIYEAVSRSILDSDIVLLSGGSSKGEKDYTKTVLERVCGSILTHGISIKPGKPTILAWESSTKTLLAGLPGHPMAALLMFHLLIKDWFEDQTGQSKLKPYPARMGENVSSNQGRETCLPVRLIPEAAGYRAEPLYAKSGSISVLAKADGYIRIPRNREGLRKDEEVWVEVFG